MWPEGASGRGRLGGALAALVLLGACGFAPAYGPGGTGTALRGQVAVAAPDSPDGYALRARLEDRLGAPEAATRALALSVDVEVEAVAAALTPEGAITRYDLVGWAPWRLAEAGGAVPPDAQPEARLDAPLAEGVADGFTGYSATGPTVATEAAEADARERLMVLLADEIVARLLLLPAEAIAPAATGAARP